MMGHKTSVAKRIEDPQPRSYPTPCHRHSRRCLIISEGAIISRLKPSSLADNTLLDLHNSSYHTQPRPIIANYTVLSSRQLKQNRWISGLFLLING